MDTKLMIYANSRQKTDKWVWGKCGWSRIGLMEWNGRYIVNGVYYDTASIFHRLSLTLSSTDII